MGTTIRYHANGFTCPSNRYQITSWLGLALFSSVYYSLIAPNLSSSFSLCSIICYTVALLWVLVCGFLSTFLDPSDPGVKHQRDPEHNPMSETVNYYPKLCLKCKTRVSAKSKHCQTCHRCTADFDHHCVWLNNCVGSRNYSWFFALICGVALLSGFQFSASVLLVMDVTQDEVVRSRVLEVRFRQKYEISDKGLSYFTMLICYSISSLAIFLTIAYLIIFHIYLGIRHLSTYERFLQRRKNVSRVQPAKYSIRQKDGTQVTEPVPVEVKSGINLTLQQGAVEDQIQTFSLQGRRMGTLSDLLVRNPASTEVIKSESSQLNCSTAP